MLRSDSNFENMFIRNAWLPLPDAELLDLLSNSQSSMGEANLEKYISRVYKTDKGQTVSRVKSYSGESFSEIGQSEKVHWFNLRNDLVAMPAYFCAGHKAGLSQEQEAELLLKLADGAREFSMMGVTSQIKNLTQILQQTDPAHPEITYTGLLNFIDTAIQDGSTARSMGITNLGLRAGMSLEQTLDIVQTIYERSSLPDYAFRALYDELNAMGSNTASGAALHGALKGVLGNNPYFDADFVGFVKLAEVATACSGYSLSEVFEKIAAASGCPPRLSSPQEEVENWQAVSEGKTALVSAAEAFSLASVASKTPDQYFPILNKPGLVHGVFPYRMKRSLAEGLSDLEALMKTENAEGGFVFDAEQQIWYSLGGRTRIGDGRVRHEYFPYDISKLSSAPTFVHVHPQKGECFVAPHRDNLAYPQLQEKLTKLSSALPSTADWKSMSRILDDAERSVNIRSLIVTSTGITEMVFPQDVARIDRFAEAYGANRDQALQEFDAERYLRQQGVNDDYRGFVATLLPVINSSLPSGFAIKQYPLGHFNQQKVEKRLSYLHAFSQN